MKNDKRIAELTETLVKLTKPCDFPEGRKEDFRWMYNQPLSVFYKVRLDLPEILSLIEKLKVLNNDCGAF